MFNTLRNILLSLLASTLKTVANPHTVLAGITDDGDDRNDRNDWG